MGNNKWKPVTQGPVVEQAAQAANNTPNQGVNPSPNGDPPVPTLADSQPTANPPATGQEPAPATVPATVPVTDLAALVGSLTPEQLAKVRELAFAKGIAQSIVPRKGPNGGRIVSIEIPPEACEALTEWSNEAGMPFDEWVGKIAGDAVISYVFGDWGAVAEKAPVPVIVPEPVAAK